MSEHKGLPVPAMAPLHPNKPLRAIVTGETWTKRASQKCSNKRPTCKVARYRQDSCWVYVDLGGFGTRRISWRVFRRDWE